VMALNQIRRASMYKSAISIRGGHSWVLVGNFARVESRQDQLTVSALMLDRYCFTFTFGHANCAPLYSHKAKRLMHCNKPLYSITSAARAKSLAGMVRPNAFAVFKVMMNSNQSSCSTGMRSRPDVPSARRASCPADRPARPVRSARSGPAAKGLNLGSST
jgi:hypothetical protein